MASGIGAELETPPIAAHAFWFGEDQARYVVTADPGKAGRILDRAKAAGVPVREIGTTGGDALAVAGERAIPVAKLRERFEGWLPAFMARRAPVTARASSHEETRQSRLRRRGGAAASGDADQRGPARRRHCDLHDLSADHRPRGGRVGRCALRHAADGHARARRRGAVAGVAARAGRQPLPGAVDLHRRLSRAVAAGREDWRDAAGVGHDDLRRAGRGGAVAGVDAVAHLHPLGDCGPRGVPDRRHHRARGAARSARGGDVGLALRSRCRHRRPGARGDDRPQHLEQGSASPVLHPHRHDRRIRRGGRDRPADARRFPVGAGAAACRAADACACQLRVRSGVDHSVRRHRPCRGDGRDRGHRHLPAH